MSRTRRKDHYIDRTGKPLFGKEHKVFGDHKKWYKPNRNFKKTLKDGRKAKERDAMRHDPENIPIFKKEDTWLWN